MLALRAASFLARNTTKPTLYAATIATVLWVAIDLFDGASDRFHNRIGQAKSEVIPPAENVMTTVTDLATKLWASIESNPGPSILALGLFIFTIVYHKVKGHSTVDALKMTILKDNPAPTTSPAVAKAQQAAIEEQMLDMYEKIERRQKALPQEIINANERVKQAEIAHKRAHEASERANIELMKLQGYADRLKREYEEGAETIVQLELELNKIT